MELPGNSVGISDILQYKACPQAFAFGMRRHAALPERFALYAGEKDEPPESESYASAYGHAIHEACRLMDDTSCSPDFAIQETWRQFNHWLEPADLDRMKADIQTYEGRGVPGYRLIGAELELRAPLMRLGDETIFFRGRIDALYQNIDNPSVFLMRDYKSSRFPVAEADIHSDPQMWAYNWMIHEVYPECETLVQLYEQFRYGVVPTRKSDEQRQTMKEWLTRMVTIIIGDDLLKPKRNDKCHWCPIAMDCRETHRSADYWKNRIGALTTTVKEGRSRVIKLQPEVFGYEDYTEILPAMKDSLKAMELFIKTVEQDLKEMPQAQREALGYELSRPRRIDTWDAGALRAIHELIGDDLFQIAKLSKTEIEGFFGSDSDMANRITDMATKKEYSPSVKPKR